MAKISKEELSGFNSENGFRVCTLCGKEHLTHGGCWCGGLADIAICKECANNVLHLYLDVMLDDDSEDFNKLNVNEKKLFILKLVNIALEKKCS